MLTSAEIISLVMDKYRVESKAENFALFIVRDNGEQKKLAPDDYPLLTRVLIGPHEDVARLFLMDAEVAHEIRWDEIVDLNMRMSVKFDSSFLLFQPFSYTVPKSLSFSTSPFPSAVPSSSDITRRKSANCLKYAKSELNAHPIANLQIEWN